MNAISLLKSAILADAMETDWVDSQPTEITPENLDTLWDLFEEDDNRWDLMAEFRQSGIDTGLPSDYSRHYDCKAVARKCNTISGEIWTGWDFWYGGGKWGEPDAIDWVGSAYLLSCIETQEVVTVRKFTVIGE